MDLINALEGLASELRKELDQASLFSQEKLEELRVDFLGRKGRLAQIMSKLSSLSPEERPAVGQKANTVKQECSRLFDACKQAIEARREAAAVAGFDPSLPGRTPWQGSLHPDTLVMEEVCGIFRGLGFDIAQGPEVEIDHYNFEALNMPPEHPARDMQDTLYVTDTVLMRTHTSPVQVRTMLARRPPVAVVVPGKVYRRDSDLTHTPMFHQIEGLMVDRGISMAHLCGMLTAFVRAVFGPATEVRFRQSFFPFTEPSAEVDISCFLCGGKGHGHGEPCRVCKGTGWVEILGCGMVDPAVFAAVDYPSDVTGFAFGMGVERIAMLKYGIGDLRMFFENDVRFLSQFA
ncbi:MAG: phenylalanine--tRNA ligase subunit alpha [Desulfovibrio sp.]|nr:phenylalanine--tRNA ligase subunit alpha [Desulfovibrio sp.]